MYKVRNGTHIFSQKIYTIHTANVFDDSKDIIIVK